MEHHLPPRSLDHLGIIEEAKGEGELGQYYVRS
jgi:hypothetical protein